MKINKKKVFTACSIMLSILEKHKERKYKSLLNPLDEYTHICKYQTRGRGGHGNLSRSLICLLRCWDFISLSALVTFISFSFHRLSFSLANLTELDSQK